MKNKLNPILIKNGTLFTNGNFVKKDILVDNGKITSIEDKINAENFVSVDIIDAKGKHIIPGMIDLHVHFREPGYSYKGTIKNGSHAAAAGGFTTVCTMPNLNPAPDSKPHLQEQLDIIERDASIKVWPYATITRKRMGRELVDYQELAPYVAGFSDDGFGVQDESVMREAMAGIAKTGKILAAHCEVESLLNGGYIHDGEYARNNNHKGICSESEWKEVERDIRLAKETGCRLHLCHISTKESVDLIRKAKKEGVEVTCETAPHYLMFCDTDLKEDGRFKMNPPIRSCDDREALRQGVIDGTIDVIATDHAPHSADEKSRGLAKSAMGIVGLETALPVVYTVMVKSGMITLERLIELFSLNPAKILKLEASVKEGESANLTIVDFDGTTLVDSNKFKSKGKATPFDGMELSSKIIATICNGKTVFFSRD